MYLDRVTLNPKRYPTTEKYPYNLDIFHQTPRLDFTTPVTFFVGENGTGKSTLLKAVCQKCGIHIWSEIDRPRYESNPYEGTLHRAIDITWSEDSVPGSFFDSQTFRNFTAMLDEWATTGPGMLDYFGGKSLMTQSHGQSLMSYFKSRYRIRGIYFLDEPETALSPKSQVLLLEVLEEMSRAGHAQFIIATHSPILLACSGAKIFSFDSSPISTIEYEDTDHFQVYRDFLKG